MWKKLFAIALLLLTTTASAQSVCLPAPRLLTTMPMGAQVGTSVEVAVTGEDIGHAERLLFSVPGITAEPKRDATGKPLPNKFIVTVAAGCETGIHEARVLTRLGISSSRVFSVDTLPEVKQDKPTTTVETAMPLKLNSICNATSTNRAVNHYSFQATKGQRIVVDCAARGIDSKMNPVVIIADEKGADLLVERRGGVLDFTIPAAGKYLVKVHDLTFNGGAGRFFRLALREIAADASITRSPSTRAVKSFSWPPANIAAKAPTTEVEPNNQHAQAQNITLPCDISGNFYPAADVDTFQFTAKKGEVWWVEVASERLGLQTDPSIIVQHISGKGDDEKRVDVVELTDIASPIRRSAYGYSYSGPPYNAGSADILGKIEIKQDGVHRLQLTDLLGGVRNDPNNVYRLIIRKAAPDFAIVAWRLHMELRNGDRNALSKPLALRGGSTVALEVVVVRRDGFKGEIELALENLPEGVTAAGLKIPAGKPRGIMLVTVAQEAPRSFTFAKFTGRAMIDGKEVTHPCHIASMAWPIRNHSSYKTDPRLVANLPVSVGASEVVAFSIAPQDKKVWEVKAGETLTIPLSHVRRDELSGKIIGLKTFGSGFESNAKFDVSITADESQAVLDLAKLKTPPGDYLIAFYGTVVAKYRYNPNAVVDAELAHKQAEQEASKLSGEAKRLANEVKNASADQKVATQAAIKATDAKLKVANAAVVAAKKIVVAAKAKAKPKDIADILVSEPITIRVTK